MIAYTTASVNGFARFARCDLKVHRGAVTYIIDGHNLIGVMPDIKLGDPDDEVRLLERLRLYRASSGGQKILAFFDGGDLPPNPAQVLGPRSNHLSSPGIEVRFSEPGQTADDAIIAFLQSRTQPGQYAVITNDAELAGRARASGASSLRASDFAPKLVRRKPRPAPAKSIPGPDPHAPEFADIYEGFVAAERAAGGLRERAQISDARLVEEIYGDDVEAAQRAARWLGLYGSVEAVGPLHDALTHGDVRVRAASLLALGELVSRSVAPAHSAGPGAPDRTEGQKLRQAIVFTLCDRLLKDPGTLAREAAAQSLGRIGDRAAEGALEDAVRNDAKRKVRKAAQAALSQIRARR
jgi:predicted RNA-binding protein with PIN domain